MEAAEVDVERGRFRIGTEDILAIGAVVVAIIIANGIVSRSVDATAGGAIITALVGAAGIAQVIKSRRRPKARKKEAESKPNTPQTATALVCPVARRQISSDCTMAASR